ncbi:hypothetical protein [Streptomyces sp. CBMA152]|uniref:hypothetical protein n=1 Tax=Streptomyces sp. CBMA152 TaxID=1896312 RepID=UPI001660E9D9|nr:hypothetical protein [Streptomyces sp. CBMA152]MBD0743561.1 hypothetical protein [Streptomyces sp. CBMA152]
MTTTVVKQVSGKPATSPEPRFDPVALAEAEAIRKRAEAEAEAIRIKAQGEVEAERLRAAEEAEKQRLANERAAMRLEKDKVSHEAFVAKRNTEIARSNAETDEVTKTAADKASREAQRLAEQERSERWWRWGARGIYAIGLIIAAPVQFEHFWDPQHPFLVAAPGLLEGFALALAFGAAWAVAHRRDVLPYRIGIMVGALIAAGVNLYGGMTDPEIGFNAGLIGAIASLGGPVVLMTYERGIAQKADGIPSRREIRATKKQAAAEATAAAKARTEKAAADERSRIAAEAAEARTKAEQMHRDEDRQQHHPAVWKIANSIRSARGCQHVTEQIWAEAWHRVTGFRQVGVTLDIDTQSRAAEARAATAAQAPVLGPRSLVDSQIKPRQKKDPGAPDGRRNNGSTPPVRRPGDTPPYSEGARRQIGRTTAARRTVDGAPHHPFAAPENSRPSDN